MKNIRILIVNNPLTAIFMCAQLTEVESEDKDTETIVFYEERLRAGTFENPEQLEKEHKQYVLCLLKDKYTIFYPPVIYFTHPTFINQIKNFKKIKQEQLDNQLKIKLFLDNVSISNANIIEIWHGNTQWQKYLKLFFLSATTFKFDHGLSETLMYFVNPERTITQYIYSKLRLRKFLNYVGWLYFVVPPIEKEADIHFTLNSRQINAALGCEKTRPISPDSVMSNAIFSTKDNIDLNPDSRLAVVLLDNIKPWAKSNSEQEEYFYDFETMLLTDYVSKLEENKINAIIFKPKHGHAEYAREAINGFNRLARIFELKYFPDLFDNLPLEYFLGSLNPKVIIGNLSSGLYYAKHLLPTVETYTYDKWFVDYTMRKFGTTFPDFQIIRPILYGNHAKYFENLNPIDVSQCKESVFNGE